MNPVASDLLLLFEIHLHFRIEFNGVESFSLVDIDHIDIVGVIAPVGQISCCVRKGVIKQSGDAAVGCGQLLLRRGVGIEATAHRRWR